MRFDGFIFDLDGTLADSMWLWDGLLDQWLMHRGFGPQPGLAEEIAHMTATQSAELAVKRFHLSETPEQVMGQWTQLSMDAYAHKIQPKPGAVDFLKCLKAQGMPIALATSCIPETAYAFLDAHDIRPLIDAIVFTDQVARGKEYPDVYLEAARRIRVNPQKCVVFEDIPQAVKGVRAAGMALVGVSDPHCDQTLLKEKADLFIPDFTYPLLASFVGLI
nr:HAD family phosphatase [uncultured Solibaculum sp.]